MKLLDLEDNQIKVDFTDFNNHVFFGSAEQTFLKAFTRVTDLYNASASYTSESVVNITSSGYYSQSAYDTYSMFTPFEKWLYNDEDGWPKYGLASESLLNPTSSQVTTWYNTQIDSSSTYDSTNQSYLRH